MDRLFLATAGSPNRSRRGGFGFGRTPMPPGVLLGSFQSPMPASVLTAARKTQIFVDPGAFSVPMPKASLPACPRSARNLAPHTGCIECSCCLVPVTLDPSNSCRRCHSLHSNHMLNRGYAYTTVIISKYHGQTVLSHLASIYPHSTPQAWQKI